MIQPEPSSRHQLVVCLLIVCFLSGIGPLSGKSPAPGSINAVVSHGTMLLWACMLTFGSALYLIALVMQPRRLVTGVLMERVAAFALGAAGIIYGAAVLGAAGWSAILSAALIFTFGGLCFSRWRSIGKQIKAAKRAHAQH